MKTKKKKRIKKTNATSNTSPKTKKIDTNTRTVIKIIVTAPEPQDQSSILIENEEGTGTAGSFWVLTPVRDDSKNKFHSGYFEYSGTTIKAALQTGLTDVTSMTGSSSYIIKSQYEENQSIYYHVHFSASDNVYQFLFNRENKVISTLTVATRKTRRTSIEAGSEYLFIKYTDLSLSPIMQDELAELYKKIHAVLFIIPKRMGANCGGAAGRSSEYRPAAIAGSAGFSLQYSDVPVINKIYTYFYSHYRKKKERNSFFFELPTLLSQKSESPNKRSPGSRIYVRVDGMGVPIYVTQKPSNHDTEAVRAAAKAANINKKLQFDLSDDSDDGSNGNIVIESMEIQLTDSKKNSCPTTVASDFNTSLFSNNELTTLRMLENESDTDSDTDIDSMEIQLAVNKKFSDPATVASDVDTSLISNGELAALTASTSGKNKNSFFLKKEATQSKTAVYDEKISNSENLVSDDEAITEESEQEEKTVLFHHQSITTLSCPDDFDENTKLTYIGDKASVERELKNVEIVQQETLTKKKLDQCKKEKEAIGYKRRPGQFDLFGLSADKAALACDIKDGLSREWTHLIAHEFLGNKKAQTKGNLVLATYACNTAMMHLEFVIKKLLLAKHDISVEVTAQADNSTPERSKYHCVSIISYVITIDGKRIPFNFDPDLALNPPKNLWKGMLAQVVSKLIYSPEASNDVALNFDTCKMDLKELQEYLKKPVVEVASNDTFSAEDSKRTFTAEESKNKKIGLDLFETDLPIPVAKVSCYC